MPGMQGGLNVMLAQAALATPRYATLITLCSGSYLTAMGMTPSAAQITTAYNSIVTNLVTAGFTTADADEIAKAAVMTYVAGITSGVAGYGTILATKAAAAAALAVAIGIAAMPACAGECPTMLVASLAAALAEIDPSIMVATAGVMLANLINDGLISS